MKPIMLFILIFPSSFLNAGTPVSTMLPINEIYIPKGYDSNDNIEVIVSGHLPNMCHNTPTFDILKENGLIRMRITSLVYDPTNPFCPEIIIPFQETIKIGKLSKGKYHLEVNDNSPHHKSRFFEVTSPNSNEIDNHKYANIYKVNLNPENSFLELSGFNPSHCYELDRVDFFSNENVLSILPIMKKNSDFCPLKMTPFTYEIDLRRELSESSRTLLHIRASEGRSHNLLYDPIYNLE